MVALYHHPDQAVLAQNHQKLLKNAGLSGKPTETSEPFKLKFLKNLPKNQPALLLDASGLWLALNDGVQPMKIQPNWLNMQQRVVSAGKKSELLLKAAKIAPNMTVIDATAGLGHDAILMAGRGAQVVMLEQHVLMHALLTDAMRQIGERPNWQSLHARLTLVHTGAADFLSTQAQKVDLVYLDPMFPDGSYKSAQVGKAMQVLHSLAKPPKLQQAKKLLDAALHAGKRVIVKRPKGAPPLAEREPANTWENDVVRFDGYQDW